MLREKVTGRIAHRRDGCPNTPPASLSSTASEHPGACVGAHGDLCVWQLRKKSGRQRVSINDLIQVKLGIPKE